MKLAVFDLDATIWYPEMYQIRGPPKLVPVDKLRGGRLSPTELDETRTNRKGMVLADRNLDPMRVFGGASYALSEINRLREEGRDIRAAVASKTDEPRWARICLDHLVIDGGRLPLKDCFESHLVEISYGSKANHLQRLHSKTGVPYNEICFFDNEHWNIHDVSNSLPDVKCFYTPNGMTKQAWDEAKAAFGL